MTIPRWVGSTPSASGAHGGGRASGWRCCCTRSTPCARSGLRRAGLGVDSGSLTGATRLYARAGMSVSREIALYELELRPGEELGTQA